MVGRLEGVQKQQLAAQIDALVVLAAQVVAIFDTGREKDVEVSKENYAKTTYGNEAYEIAEG
jgi:hypothetical protein